MINDASLVMIPSGYKDGKLYSVKPTDGSGDFTFSRGSNLAATRVNSEGLIEKGRENLLLQSNQFDTTWFNSNTTETGGQSDKDGGNDAWLLSVVAAGGRITQNISQSGVQTFSVYAKAGTYDFLDVLALGSVGRAAYFDLANGSVGITYDVLDANIEDVGNGWYRCSITFNDTISNVRLYPAIADNDLTGTSGNIYIQDAQLEAGLVATDYIETTTTTAQAGILEDMPRLNYGTCPSLLLEPQRTNIATNSEYMLGFSKGAASSLQGNAAISPDGKSNATYFYCNTTTTNAYLLPSFSGTSGVQYAVSFYAKAKELNRVYIKNVNDSGGQSWFDLSDGTYNLLSGIDSMSIESVGNGWYRCVAISTSTSTAIKWIPILKGDANEGVYVYGLQIESGSYPTSYIPTYGASVTRGEDDCSKTGISSLIGQTEGTIYAEIDVNVLNSNTTRRILTLTDGTTSNRIVLYLDSNDRISVFIMYGGASQWDLRATTISENVYKIAIGYAENDCILYVNGASVGTDTTASIPAMSRLDIGNQLGSNILGDLINQTVLFKTRLSNDELAALTS